MVQNNNIDPMDNTPPDNNEQDDADFSFRQQRFDENSVPDAITSLIQNKLAVRQLEMEMFDRVKTENDVRRFKRMGKSCPFEHGGICGSVVIRCGERQQYSIPESHTEKRLPHRCNFVPKLRKEQLHILVVDDDSVIREMCIDFLHVAGFDSSQIETSQSTEDAIDALKVAKIQNKPYHLVISDIKMGGASGYHLVNHIVERNFNARILLISAFTDGKDAPNNYLGNAEILPGKKVVNYFMRKPVQLSDFNRLVLEAASDFIDS
jgi:CheY-like chemotaxis protein